MSEALASRRIRHVQREIMLLEHMDARLWRQMLICAGLSILPMAALFTFVAWKIHWLTLSPALAVLACIALAGFCWWLARYALWVPVIIVLLFLSLALSFLFEAPINLAGDGALYPGQDKKTARQAKVASALAKRKLLLAKLEARNAVTGAIHDPHP